MPIVVRRARLVVVALTVVAAGCYVSAGEAGSRAEADGRADGLSDAGTEDGADGEGESNEYADDAMDADVDVCLDVDHPCPALADGGLPLGPELCNGIDDDCDGRIDEDVFGVLEGPWAIVGDGELPGAWSWSGARTSGGSLVVAWYDAQDLWSGRYAMLLPGETAAHAVALPARIVNGICVLATDDGVLLFHTTGPRFGSLEGEGPHTLWMSRLGEDGTLGVATAIWATPFLSTSMEIAGGTTQGNHIILGLRGYFPLPSGRGPEGTGVVAALVVVDIVDGAVVDVWPEDYGGSLPPTLYGVFLVTGGRSWRTAWYTDCDRFGMEVMFPGPPESPLAGTVYRVPESALPDDTDRRFWLLRYPGAVSASDDSLLIASFARLDACDTWSQTMTEVRRDGEELVVARMLAIWTGRQGRSFLPAPLASGRFVFDAWPAPDDVRREAFWHADTLDDLAAAPTPSVIAEDVVETEGECIVSWLLPASSVAGQAALAIVTTGRPADPHHHAVVVGCLP